MEFNLELPTRANYIRQYIPHTSFLIDQSEYNTPLIIYQDKIINNWLQKKHYFNIDLLEQNDFTKLADLIGFLPEILIIGTGSKQVFPKQIKLLPIIQKKIAYDIMDTNSACKTFNILQQENRDVCAALLL